MKWLLVLLVACTPAARTGAVLSAVDVAYAAAMASCIDREGAIVASARAGRLTPQKALEEFDAISQRCYRTRAAFEVILMLVEDGRLEEAEAALRKLREAGP